MLVWGRGRLSALAVGLVMLGGAAPVQAAPDLPPGFSRANPIPSPNAMVLRASNGYTAFIAAPSTEELASSGLRHEAAFGFFDRDGSVVYGAPAVLRDEGIRARVHGVGVVDLRWRPNGRVGLIRGRCEGSPFRLFIAEGSYVGRVRLWGERGFTRVQASRVNGRTGWYRYRTCGFRTSEGFPGPGVLLDAFRRESASPKGTYRRLSVVQNGPDEKVSYGAGIGERHGLVSVSWEAFATGPARGLSFDSRLDTATLAPPRPFSGSAEFERLAKGAPGRWRGDLSVDFPGRPDVRFAGKDFGALFKRGFRETFSSRPALRPRLRPSEARPWFVADEPE